MSSAAKHREQNANDEETEDRGPSAESGGKFRTLRLVQVDFEDGSSVIAPDGEVSVARSPADTVGDIIGIACKLFPRLCAPPDKKPDTKPGCYTIIGPDGTKITICPPGAGTIA
jgi:hypothetical protein